MTCVAMVMIYIVLFVLHCYSDNLCSFLAVLLSCCVLFVVVSSIIIVVVIN